MATSGENKKSSYKTIIMLYWFVEAETWIDDALLSTPAIR